MTYVMPLNDKPPQYQGAAGRKRPRLRTISLAEWQIRLMDRQIEAMGLDGPSDFIQRMFGEAVGARLPCVGGGK